MTSAPRRHVVQALVAPASCQDFQEVGNRSQLPSIVTTRATGSRTINMTVTNTVLALEVVLAAATACRHDAARPSTLQPVSETMTC
jgi:hypothetical protein